MTLVVRDLVMVMMLMMGVRVLCVHNDQFEPLVKQTGWMFTANHKPHRTPSPVPHNARTHTHTHNAHSHGSLAWAFTHAKRHTSLHICHCAAEMDPQALLKLCGEYQSFCRKISTVVSQQQVRSGQ
jgi:hypothetical protein